jgi:hypothetical protein
VRADHGPWNDDDLKITRVREHDGPSPASSPARGGAGLSSAYAHLFAERLREAADRLGPLARERVPAVAIDER